MRKSFKKVLLFSLIAIVAVIAVFGVVALTRPEEHEFTTINAIQFFPYVTTYADVLKEMGEPDKSLFDEKRGVEMLYYRRTFAFDGIERPMGIIFNFKDKKLMFVEYVTRLYTIQELKTMYDYYSNRYKSRTLQQISILYDFHRDVHFGEDLSLEALVNLRRYTLDLFTERAYLIQYLNFIDYKHLLKGQTKFNLVVQQGWYGGGAGYNPTVFIPVNCIIVTQDYDNHVPEGIRTCRILDENDTNWRKRTKCAIKEKMPTYPYPSSYVNISGYRTYMFSVTFGNIADILWLRGVRWSGIFKVDF